MVTSASAKSVSRKGGGDVGGVEGRWSPLARCSDGIGEEIGSLLLQLASSILGFVGGEGSVGQGVYLLLEGRDGHAAVGEVEEVVVVDSLVRRRVHSEVVATLVADLLLHLHLLLLVLVHLLLKGRVQNVLLGEGGCLVQGWLDHVRHRRHVHPTLVHVLLLVRRHVLLL